VSGYRSINEREGERKDISGEPSPKAQQRVPGQRQWGEIDNELSVKRRVDLSRQRDQSTNDSCNKNQEKEIRTPRFGVLQRIAHASGMEDNQRHRFSFSYRLGREGAAIAISPLNAFS
jgi:hypothetical protein